MVDIEYDITIVNGGLSLFIKQHTQEGAIPGGLRTSYGYGSSSDPINLSLKGWIWMIYSVHWFKILDFAETEEFWGIRHPAGTEPKCQRLLGLSEAVVVPVKLHVAVQRIRKRKKPKKLVAPNTSRVGRRGKSMGIGHEPWAMPIFFSGAICESRMFLCLFSMDEDV